MCMWTYKEALSSEHTSEVKTQTNLRTMNVLKPHYRNKLREEVNATSFPESERPRAQKWVLRMFVSANYGTPMAREQRVEGVGVGATALRCCSHP